MSNHEAERALAQKGQKQHHPVAFSVEGVEIQKIYKKLILEEISLSKKERHHLGVRAEKAQANATCQEEITFLQGITTQYKKG